MGNKADLKGMNVLMFITDRQRATQHVPPGWAAEDLPGQTPLMTGSAPAARPKSK